MHPWLQPKQYVVSPLEIDPEALHSLGIRGVLVDLDNTLVSWRGSEIEPEMEEWVRKSLAAGLKLVSRARQGEADRERDALRNVFVSLQPNAATAEIADRRATQAGARAQRIRRRKVDQRPIVAAPMHGRRCTGLRPGRNGRRRAAFKEHSTAALLRAALRALPLERVSGE